MKQLKDTIQEKLIIGSKTKVHKYKELSKDNEDKIFTNLCKYFQSSCVYKGIHKNRRLDVVTKYFNNDISEFFDKLDLWEDMYNYIFPWDNITFNEFINYIEFNKEKLYNDISKFIL